MRQVSVLPILLFQLLLAGPLGASVGLVIWMDDSVKNLPLGQVWLFLGAAGLFLTLATLVYRVFLALCPLPCGDVPPGSRVERVYMVYILFWLMIFLPILRIGFIPTPLSRLMLLALGARVGQGTYSSGLVMDPHFVTIGAQTQLGIDCLIIPHAQAGIDLAHHEVHIGSGVTIGARAIVLAGVSIGDGAVIAAGALLTSGTQVGPGEVWAGVPARRVAKRDLDGPGHVM